MGNTENVVDRPARQPGRTTRALVAVACATGLALTASGCGFGAQTLRAYTPAQGVNVDIGQNPENREPAVRVRGLVVVAETAATEGTEGGAPGPAGTGFLSAALYAGPEADVLTGVSGSALGDDGEPAGTLTVAEFEPVPLPASGVPVVLVDRPAITVQSPGLLAGGTVELTLELQQAGSTDVVVPVVDGSFPDYATVTPLAPSPSPTPAGT